MSSSPTKVIRIPAPDGPTLDMSRVPRFGAGGMPEWLSKFPISALLTPDFSLIIIDSQATWTQALDTLTKKNVLSAPIFDRATKTFVGLVDVLDLLAYAMKVIQDVHLPKEELEQWAFKSLPVTLMNDISLRNPWCPTYIGKPLSSLVDVFSARVSIHRVPLVDDDGRVVGLVSQSRFIQFLAEHRDVITSVMQVPIRRLMTTPAMCVSAEMRAMDALGMLLKLRVSGMGVVDRDGRLLTQLSASDLKGAAMGDLFHSLNLPLSEFLATTAQRMDKRVAVLTAYPEQTLAQAVALLASSHHIHRVFVLAEDGKPLGVLTMGDVMDAISARKF